jgi:hypothetical protein
MIKEGEIGNVYEVAYAWVKFGDKTTCAWCQKDIKEIKDPTDHIEAHDHTQKEYQKKLSRQTDEDNKRFLEMIGEDEKSLSEKVGHPMIVEKFDTSIKRDARNELRAELRNKVNRDEKTTY